MANIMELVMPGLRHLIQVEGCEVISMDARPDRDALMIAIHYQGEYMQFSISRQLLEDEQFGQVDYIVKRYCHDVRRRALHPTQLVRPLSQDIAYEPTRVKVREKRAAKVPEPTLAEKLSAVVNAEVERLCG